MSNDSARMLTPVDIPAGSEGLLALNAALAQAIADPEFAFAPLPAVSSHVPTELRESLLAALMVDEPLSAPAQVVLTTSGSTGKPKAVMHSLAAIRHSTEALHRRLGGAGHWLCALPLHTSAGFMTAARATIAGTTSTAAASLGGATPFTAENFVEAAHACLAHSGRHYASLVPQQASRLCDSAEALSVLAKFDAVLLGGQAIPGDIIDMLRKNSVNTVLSYGSTETCGGCVYDGTPLEGVDVRIADGLVVITGPVVMRGYRAGGGLNSDGSFTMADRGEMIDSQLRILGRDDDILIVKGINVSPSHIESMLAELGVRAVVVADRQESLVAVVESGGDKDAGKDAVAAVRRHLGLPLRLAEVDSWPLLASGKPNRQLLSEDLNSTTDKR